MVVQLDVKKAFDHVDHRAAFKAMRLQGVSPFSMALIAAIWNGSCMKARLGTVSSSKVRMSRGLPQGAPESLVIFTMIMELVLRDLIKSWITRKLAWRLDDFVLAAICYADDVVLVAASVAAAEVMVAEVIAKLKDVGLTVGAQTTHWTSHPKMVDKSIMVDGLAVLWEEVLEFVGFKGDGVSGRECKTCDCTQISSSQQVSGEMEICSEFFMAPRVDAPEHGKNYNVAGFSLEFECLDDNQGTKGQNCELECENGGKRDWCEEASVDGDGPVVEWHRMGRWIVQHERRICHQRAMHSVGQVMLPEWTTKESVRRPGDVEDFHGGDGDSSTGKKWRKTNGLAAPTAFQNLQVGGHGGGGGFQILWKCRRFFEISPEFHGLAASCSKPCELETICEIFGKSP